MSVWRPRLTQAWHTIGAQCIPVELNDKSDGPQARELKAITPDRPFLPVYKSLMAGAAATLLCPSVEHREEETQGKRQMSATLRASSWGGVQAPLLSVTSIPVEWGCKAMFFRAEVLTSDPVRAITTF